MPEASKGNTVRVHYTGKFADGTIFDSSVDREPIEFTLGKGQVIPGFEAAISGMKPGDATTVTIPAEKAYGPHRQEMVLRVDRSQFPENMQLVVDAKLRIGLRNGQTAIVTVTEVGEDQVTLDANHPLAGKDLTFDLRLVEIVES